MTTKNIYMKVVLLVLMYIVLIANANSREIACSKQAIEFSEKIVRYHLESQSTPSMNFLLEVDRDSIKKLPSIRNPAMPSELLAGIEVRINISTTATYRTRFIFNTKGGFCSLVGQEILEVTVGKDG